MISTLPLPASRPLPLIQSILFFLNRNSTPPVRPLTILSLRACTCAMSMPMAASTERQAPLLPVLRDLERVRVLEQRLGRNAAPVQAGAAEHRRALDDGGREAELRGADRGHVAAGAGADHHDVVFVRHLLVFLPDCRQRDEGHRAEAAAGRRGSLGVASPRLGIEPRHLRSETRVVVAQFPVRLVQRARAARSQAARPSASATSASEQGRRLQTTHDTTTIYLTKKPPKPHKRAEGRRKTRYNRRAPAHGRLEDHPDLRRRSGDARHDCAPSSSAITAC